MCAIGSSSNNSLAAVSPQATGLGGMSIGGSYLSGGLRRNARGSSNTVLGGSGTPGAGGAGGNRPGTAPRPNRLYVLDR